MRRRESRRRSRHNRTSKSPAMWPGFLAAQIVREYSLLLIFLCKIFPEKLDKARGGRRGILDSPFQSTPPARGATGAGARRQRPQGGISIHAPREGGRRLEPEGPDSLSAFQSTPPARGATGGGAVRPGGAAHFNPRPPRGGRRGERGGNELVVLISIHAPARGATITSRGGW